MELSLHLHKVVLVHAANSSKRSPSGRTKLHILHLAPQPSLLDKTTHSGMQITTPLSYPLLLHALLLLSCPALAAPYSATLSAQAR